MLVSIAANPAVGKSFGQLKDHAAVGRFLASVMSADPRVRGRVLDVGCGASGPTIEHYFDLYRLPALLDGVDPMPGVENNPWVDRAWHSEFDSAPIPETHYDALLSINVVEHVANPATFLAQAFRVLKPGGALYAVTPNAVHPFPPCVRVIQALGLKEKMVKGQTGWNDYPAYYRLNSRGSVIRFGERAGFSAAHFVHHPNLQWKQYFPGPLKAFPIAFDFVLGTRVPVLFQMLLWRLEKPGQWVDDRMPPPAVKRPRG